MAKYGALYRTYIIRCWQEPCVQPDTFIYRYSLEIPAAGERLGFTCSEDLIDALKTALVQIQPQVISNVPSDDES